MTAKSPEGGSSPSALLAPGSLVDHFRVARLIGRGGMGEVYLARDTKLGRKVALKVIRPEGLEDARSVDALLREARITARFNHPHIVMIHSVGEIGGSPYLALEHLEGGSTLRQRMDDEAPSMRESLRIALAIAEALVEAHKHGVLHRDLKPENVLIPQDGRLRVVDFGLAQALSLSGGKTPLPKPINKVDDIAVGERETAVCLEDDSSGVVGTPGYMAPEQWMGDESTGQTDIWALGVILYELVSGAPPFEAPTIIGLCGSVCTEPHPPPSSAPALPKELSTLIDRCLEKEAAQRPTAHEVAGVLRSLLTRERNLSAAQLRPFRGLMPFSERHAELFFGRDGEIAAFIERLRDTPILPIIGPSGAGKSSFVQAGVIPRLRDQGRWVVLQLRPGADPLGALVLRLQRGETDAFSEPTLRSLSNNSWRGLASSPPPPLDEQDGQGALSIEYSNEELREQLRQNKALLALLLGQIAEAEDSKVLLFIDQLEELYALASEESDEESQQLRRDFMEIICHAADDPLGPVRVVFTLRDDFMVRLAETEIAREILGNITVLRSPEPEALREILTQPLERAGYSYEDDELPEEMIRAVGAELACLPALQFACTKLWDARDKTRRVLTWQAYIDMGGVEGALARHADEVLEGLSSEQSDIARQLLLRLVTPEGTRRTLARSQLVDGFDADQQLVEDVLKRLIDGRTITVRKGHHQGSGEAVVELTHESLITRWSKLARWVEESREEVTFLAEIGQAAELWARRGELDDEVWSGDALQQALARSRRCAALPDGVRRFLDAGQRRSRRQARRKKLLTVGTIAGLTLLAGVIGLVALELAAKERSANIARQHAEEGRAEAQREGAYSALARGDMLAARAGLRQSLEADDRPLTRALWWRLRDEPLLMRKQIGFPIYALAATPDGSTVATGCASGAIYLLDTHTQDVRFLRGHDSQVLALDIAPDGRTLASATLTGEIALWDLSSGNRLHTLQGHTDKIWGLRIAPDGTRLLSASHDETVRLWTITPEGVQNQKLGTHEGCAWPVAISPDGELGASGGCDGVITLWNLNSAGKGLAQLEGHAERVQSLDFSADGRWLASASRDETIRLWDIPSGEPAGVLRGHLGRARSVRFHPDGKRLVSSGDDGAIRVWDLNTKKQLRLLDGHQSWVWTLAFVGDQRAKARLISGSHDRSIRIWNIDAGQNSRLIGGHDEGLQGVSFQPRTQQIATSSRDGTIRFWDVKQGLTTRLGRTSTGGSWGIQFSPDGAIMATSGEGETLVLRSEPSGQTLTELAGHVRWYSESSFSPEGDLIASAVRGDAVGVWDVRTGEQRLLLQGHEAGITSVSFAPNGESLASGSHDGTIRLWNIDDGSCQAVLRGHGGCVSSVCFAAESELLLSGGCDGVLRSWELPSGRGHVLGEHEDRIHRVRFHAATGRIATASADGTAKIWASDGRPIATLVGHRDEVNGVAFDESGTLVATASDDHTLRLWDAETGRPRWQMPVMLADPTEIFSQQGWEILSPDPLRRRPSQSAWRDAVEARGRYGVSASASPLCLVTDDGLEAWDLEEDQRLFQNAGEAVDELVAVDSGCLVRRGDQLWLFDREGNAHRLADDVLTLCRERVGSGEQATIVVGPDRARRLSLSEVQSATTVLEDVRLDGASTAAHVDDHLVVGYREGALRAFALNDARQIACDQVPAARATRITAGPRSSNTFIAGYEDGSFGIWSLENGRRLHRGALHGAIVHIVLEGQTLFVGSELGQHRTLDLSAFTMDYCELLHEVWDEVPIVLDGGRLIETPIPADHRCAQSIQRASAASRSSGAADGR